MNRSSFYVSPSVPSINEIFRSSNADVQPSETQDTTLHRNSILVWYITMECPESLSTFFVAEQYEPLVTFITFNYLVRVSSHLILYLAHFVCIHFLVRLLGLLLYLSL